MSRTVRSAIALVPLLLAVGCADPAKAPAEAALAAATSAAESLKGDAARYAPEVVRSIEDGLASAQAAMNRKDYKAVMEAVSGIPDKARNAVTLSATRKEQLDAAWTNVVAAAEKGVSDLKARLAELSKARKLPRGVERQAVDAAQDGVALLEDGWKRAVDLARSGDYVNAIPGAMRVKVKAEELLKSVSGK